jgi:hypothetical protein
MNEQYRGFNLYGGCEPFSETLLGQVTHWKPTGCIAHKHRNGVITELMRFVFPMNCDEENVAKCFGWKLPGFCWTQVFVILRSPGMRARNG